ncbi:MAG TPA: hypothetical protein VF384_01970 [Planctomycetota bacterium]
MSYRFVAVVVVSVLVGASCKSSPPGTCADTQSVVETVAEQHPEVVRLTVHSSQTTGGACLAIASTSADKLGTPSDKEDLTAINDGRTIVLDEPGAIDVTVPILQKDGKWTAACGVTVKAAAGTSRDQLVANANSVAKAVEASMAAKALPAKAMPAKGK